MFSSKKASIFLDENNGFVPPKNLDKTKDSNHQRGTCNTGSASARRRHSPESNPGKENSFLARGATAHKKVKASTMVFLDSNGYQCGFRAPTKPKHERWTHTTASQSCPSRASPSTNNRAMRRAQTQPKRSHSSGAVNVTRARKRVIGLSQPREDTMEGEGIFVRSKGKTDKGWRWFSHDE